MRLLIGLSLLVSISGMASGAEWKYCVAPSQTENRIYLTSPFSGQTQAADAEAAFAEFLHSSGFAHDDVQCPRTGSETAALEMHQHTIKVNKLLGNDIVELRWRPHN